MRNQEYLLYDFGASIGDTVWHNLVTSVTQQQLNGSYYIFPAQPPRRLEGSEPPPFVEPNQVVYNSNTPYPMQVPPQKSSSGGENDSPSDEQNKEDKPFKARMNDNEKTQIRIQPNPTHGKLAIDSNHLSMQDLIIYNVVGEELIRVSAINSQQTTLHVESLYAGIYFLKIITEDGGQQTKKFVKH